MDEYIKKFDFASYSFSQKVMRGGSTTEGVTAIGAAQFRSGSNFTPLTDAAGAMEALLHIPIDQDMDPVCQFAMDVSRHQA